MNAFFNPRIQSSFRGLDIHYSRNITSSGISIPISSWFRFSYLRVVEHRLEIKSVYVPLYYL